MVSAAPTLPEGQAVELLGRGVTWVYDSDSHRNGQGGRPPVVLLHGWTSTSTLNWYRCFSQLSKHHRVIAMDQRGHGRGIRSRRPFRLEDCADDVAALVERLALGPVTAVGYSMGGPIAQLLWRRHREAVRGLVLCATAASFAARPELSGPLGALGFGMSVALSGVPYSVRQRGLGLVLRGRDTGIAEWVLEEWERHDPAAIIQAGLALGRFDSSGWVGEIDVPTAVVVTTKDTTVLPARQWKLARSIPGAVAFPVAGEHRACVEQPELFVPALLAACRSAERQAVAG